VLFHIVSTAPDTWEREAKVPSALKLMSGVESCGSEQMAKA
jgi:hypothetical protein